MNKQIRIEITESEREAAHEFAIETLEWTYNRYPAKEEERIRRIRVGKLAEIAFVRALNWKADNWRYQVAGVLSNQRDMYEADFRTKEGEAIDVKSASKEFHKNLMIPLDQQERNPKSFFVGVGINKEETEAVILGYVNRVQVEKKKPHSKRSEYKARPAYWISFSELNDIEEVFRRM